MKEKQVPNPHDAFFRQLFAQPSVAAEFFRLYLPPAVATWLDLSQVRLEEASFVDEKLREHFSDLLFRVGLKGGGEAFIYILLEHKSAPEERISLQLLRYIVQAWDRLPTPLPWILPVVVYHGARPWNVKRHLQGLLQPFAEAQVWLRYVPNFEYHLCDLGQYGEEELAGREGLAAALKLLKFIFRRDLTTKLPAIFNQTIEETPITLAQRRLTAMVHYLKESRRVTEKQIREALLIARKEGTRMLDIWEIMNPGLVNQYRQEGRQEGHHEGHQKGLQKGRQEGRQEGVADLTLRLLHRRVGTLPPTTETQVRALPLTKLTRLGEALLDFQAPEDLEKWLQRQTAPRKRTRK